ncbi:hypothetical protein Hanom_Chr12g01074361 [Helianthus anomalus]
MTQWVVHHARLVVPDTSKSRIIRYKLHTKYKQPYSSTKLPCYINNNTTPKPLFHLRFPSLPLFIVLSAAPR